MAARGHYWTTEMTLFIILLYTFVLLKHFSFYYKTLLSLCCHFTKSTALGSSLAYACNVYSLASEVLYINPSPPSCYTSMFSGLHHQVVLIASHASMVQLFLCYYNNNNNNNNNIQ